MVTVLLCASVAYVLNHKVGVVYVPVYKKFAPQRNPITLCRLDNKFIIENYELLMFVSSGL
jgi:hypothetical protein